MAGAEERDGEERARRRRRRRVQQSRREEGMLARRCALCGGVRDVGSRVSAACELLAMKIIAFENLEIGLID